MRFAKSNRAAFTNFLAARYERLTGTTTVSSRPYSMLVDVAANCHLRCPSCPTGVENEAHRRGDSQRFRDRGLMGRELFAALLDEIGACLFHLMLYNWGEPLFHPELPLFIAKAKQLDITTEIHTNLSLQLSESRMRSLLEAGIDEIAASIDGFSQQSYSTYRRGGDFELARDNLVRLAELRTDLGLGTRIVWNFLVFSFNERELEAAEAFCCEHGIVFQRREAAIDVGRTPGWVPSHRRHELAGPRTPVAAAAAHEQEVPPRPSSCGWHYSFSVVNVSGSISPCCAVWSQEHDIGRFDGDRERFASIWNGPELRGARALANPERGAAEPAGHAILCQACPFDDGVKDLYSPFDADVKRRFDEVFGRTDPMLAAAFDLVTERPDEFVEFYRAHRERIENGAGR
ncbi:MAG: radical SAM protein [Acidobacteriota bacterium]|nr:radical SAM protein [Acidobacteriota bacterium]